MWRIMQTFFKDLIKKNDQLYLKLCVVNRVGLSLYFINFCFQRILRFQSELKFNVNFTSRIIGGNLKYHNDLTTLSSFAISGSSYIQSINGIVLGKNFLYGPGLRLISSNHDLTDKNKSVSAQPISIGDHCWFGANVIILPGVTIGNNCVIGAGSVVTKKFEEDNLVIAGNPARILRKNL